MRVLSVMDNFHPGLTAIQLVIRCQCRDATAAQSIIRGEAQSRTDILGFMP